MNKKNILKKIFIPFSTAFIFTACGGGGGGGGGTTTNTPTKQIDDPTDYSKYAWGINSNIDNTFKTDYSIHSNAHINLTTAWTITKGKYTVGTNINQGVKVAVIDEDFDVTHPDLNGKVISAFNAMDSSSNISDSDGDTYYHGSAVAGFIASTYLGASPNIQLILINIDLDSGSLTEADILRAFNHAQTQGAKVINCSWGGSQLSSTIQNKISDLKAAGITVVFASGNGDNSGNAYNLDDAGKDDPSELASVIGVGATSAANDVTKYSNYGSNIDILAPGGGTDFTNDTISIGRLGLDQTGTAGYNNTQSITGNNLVNTNYSFTQGTSFAAPTLSAVAALMYAVNHNITPDRLREILIETTDKIGTGTNYIDRVGDGTTSTFDTRRAYGKVDASAAVSQAQSEYVP